jgi:hypothetical protein
LLGLYLGLVMVVTRRQVELRGCPGREYANKSCCEGYERCRFTWFDTNKYLFLGFWQLQLGWTTCNKHLMCWIAADKPTGRAAWSILGGLGRGWGAAGSGDKWNTTVISMRNLSDADFCTGPAQSMDGVPRVPLGTSGSVSQNVGRNHA